MKNKLILIGFLLITFINTSICQEHGTRYIGKSKKEIISTLGQANLDTYEKNYELLSYVTTFNKDRQETIMYWYRIQNGVCIAVTKDYTYSAWEPAKMTFDILKKTFQLNSIVLINNKHEKLYKYDTYIIKLEIIILESYIISLVVSDRLLDYEK
ncbi:MAG: hypothetical protein M0P71_06325 [Melioribacteraceae bacterium]|nr:hypothetical protein [Melioribacteraceae bacterium]